MLMPVKYLKENGFDEPDPAAYGVWVKGIPVLVGEGLEKAGAADWLAGLINDGIVAGVGAVLGFVPQMLVLFLLLAILEGCGYMARIAFVLDRIFRKFGLSGKSFIPMLIGTGCGIPGIMASRTIENERDRRMTIMTTTFIPCGAKVPFIAMIAGAIFGGSAWVATSAYFIGMAAIIISGIMLKKTKMFAGEPAPFVMELPAYHLPTVSNVLRSTGSAAGPSSRKRARSFFCPRYSFGLPPTSDLLPTGSECLRKTSLTSPFLRQSAMRSPGSSNPSAGANGRQRLHPSPALLQRKTSLARWAFFTAQKVPFMRPLHMFSTAFRHIRSWCSTCSVHLALRQSAQ